MAWIAGRIAADDGRMRAVSRWRTSPAASRPPVVVRILGGEAENDRIRMLALAGTLVAHALLASAFLQSRPGLEAGADRDGLELRFIPYVAVPAPAAPRVPDRAATADVEPPVVPSRAEPLAVSPAPADTLDGTAGMPAPAPLPAVGPQAPGLQPRQHAPGPGERFRPDPFERRASRLPGGGAHRFRMRTPPSPQQVLGGAAQLLGLWPPGYDDDPCPRIRRNVSDLSTSFDPGDRALLDHALEMQRSFCD